MTTFEELAYISEQRSMDHVFENNPALLRIIATQPEGSPAHLGATKLVARIMSCKTDGDCESLAQDYPDFVFMGTPSKLGLVPMYGLRNKI